MPTRKILFVKERVLAEARSAAPRPVSRVAAIAVIDNPFAGGFTKDLSPLFDIGMQLGEELMATAVDMLDGPPIGYGKSAIVGVNGDVEHAAAVLHPKLGKPMRAAVNGGEAIIPSTTKVALVFCSRSSYASIRARASSGVVLPISTPATDTLRATLSEATARSIPYTAIGSRTSRMIGMTAKRERRTARGMNPGGRGPPRV